MTDKQPLTVIKNTSEVEMGLSDSARHYLVAQSQLRGVSIDKVMQGIVQSVIQKHEDTKEAEKLNIPLAEYLKTKPAQTEPTKPALQVIK